MAFVPLQVPRIGSPAAGAERAAGPEDEGASAEGEDGPKGETGSLPEIPEEGEDGLKGETGSLPEIPEEGEDGPKGETGSLPEIPEEGEDGPKGETGSLPEIPEEGEDGPKGETGSLPEIPEEGDNGSSPPGPAARWYSCHAGIAAETRSSAPTQITATIRIVPSLDVSAIDDSPPKYRRKTPFKNVSRSSKPPPVRCGIQLSVVPGSWRSGTARRSCFDLHPQGFAVPSVPLHQRSTGYVPSHCSAEDVSFLFQSRDSRHPCLHTAALPEWWEDFPQRSRNDHRRPHAPSHAPTIFASADYQDN